LLFWRGVANSGKKYFDEAILNYHEAAKILKQYYNAESYDEATYKILSECYRKISIAYYDKNDYDGAIKADQQLADLYYANFDKIEDDNGADAIFALLELSILTLNKESFKKRLVQAQRLENKEDNGEILLIFLEQFGDVVFKKSISGDELSLIIQTIENKVDSIIDNIGKDKVIRLLGYYHWNYNDIVKWVENVRRCNELEINANQYKKFISENADRLILIVKKAHEAQYKLLSKIFAESISSEDDLIK